MNVRRTPLDRVGQNAVDQLHDRRIVDLRLGRGLLLRVLHHLDIRITHVLHVLEQRLQLLIGGLVMLFQEIAQGVLAGDDREQVVPGDELQVVEHPGVGGVRHGDGQGASFTLEGEQDVFQREVPGDHLEDLRIHLEPAQVHRGHPILAGQDLGNLELLDQSQFDQNVAQPVSGGLLLAQGRRELLTCDEPFADEYVTQPIVAGRSCRHLAKIRIVRNDNGLGHFLLS